MLMSTVNRLYLVILAVIIQPLISSAQDQAPVMFAAVSEESLLFQEIPSVYGASKFEQKVTQAPSSVSIVTSQDIKKNGYRTLADILRSVSGFYMTYDRNYNYVGVRGFGRPGDYNTRVLLLIDGHRTNDNIYNHAAIGTEAILDVDLIDRVEIIRGPGSSLYGSNAFFGVINVITRRGRDLKGTEVSGEAGSFNTYKGRLSYGNRYQNGAEAIMSASAYDSNGDRLYYPEFDPANPAADPRATNGGYSDNSDYDRSQNLFSTVTFGDFTLQGAYISRTKGIPTGAYDTDFNDARNKTVDTHSYADLKYEHGLSAKTDLTIRLFYDYYHYTGDYLYSGMINKDVSNGTWAGTEVKLITRLQDMQRLIVGAEYQGSFRENQQNYDIDPYASYLDDVRRSRIMAAYLQDEITFSKSLILNAGVRYDHYSTFGGTTNPRLALIATPAEKSTIKVLYGSAFRAPNDYELYYQVPGLSVANPELKPEKITTTEVVLDQYIGDHLRASVVGYYYKIKDLINYGNDPVTGLPQFQNLEEVTAKGSQAELEGKWANGVEARISYTIQRTKDQLTGDPLTNSPAQMGKLVLNVPLMKDKIFLGVEEQYVDRRKTDAGVYAPAFAITNLTLFSQNLVPRLDASVSVYNLFDKEYGDPVTLDFLQPTIRQDGRSYRFKLTYAF
ncbi:MAG: TonB-dependent receptor [Nitrospirae bacterium]|nr:TonB-dependent receptor [Nitrospirota bacterium]NTW65612.1 TonB-dependent receptor [Nitrospirota bacterium]